MANNSKGSPSAPARSNKTLWVHVATEGLSRKPGFKYEPIEKCRLEVPDAGREAYMRAAVEKYVRIHKFRCDAFAPTDDHKLVYHAQSWGYDQAWINADGFVLFVGTREPYVRPGWLDDNEAQGEPMKMRSAEELAEKYGRDCYLTVRGSHGNLSLPRNTSEEDAVKRYEARSYGRMSKAYATVVCIPNPYGADRQHRGWIAEGYRWAEDPDSTEVLPVNPPKPMDDDMAVMDVVAKDVVITDPCYFVKDELWSDLCESWLGDASRVKPKLVEIGGAKMVLASTIYGDWMCKLEGTRNGERCRFGTFTADAGMVCAATFEKADPRELLARLPASCWTVIRQFTGRITIKHARNECRLFGCGRSEGRNVQFESVQIG